MSEGTVLVNLKNTGPAARTLQGFPGVDLTSKDGSISAARSKLAPTKVSVEPGDETRSHTLPVSIDIPASDSSTPAITVDPVGAGK
ncbi:DUF4232 domain-containing protein [Streptomyces pinistramenti]|uniref:DUF4232 domain-containing protein n=1 Tax=Streptomyces pinistramenti TaxID=2884812 RepID=UPI0022228F4D|nr:DUF4232 domain-containing protein [Streptomyces pinistramenti]